MVAKSLSGASLKLYINNRIFGIATGMEWTNDAGRRPIFGLDQINPVELATGTNRITGRIQCVRIRLDGGLEGRGIAATDDKVLSEKYISILLVDRLSDTVILKIDNAAVNEQTWRTDNKSVTRGSFSFEGIGWSNEAT